MIERKKFTAKLGEEHKLGFPFSGAVWLEQVLQLQKLPQETKQALICGGIVF
jgi:hypothetical protein